MYFLVNENLKNYSNNINKIPTNSVSRMIVHHSAFENY
ncbi:hypothetical protein NBRC3257_0626 [Gluconobacter thailandicus NBRC 3257]|uniref:Uncharacterized protein n=1 Tax=Gluconobacter thailandicus NBRC 3257 TaxID=1381097 RepID=A0ABQ0ITV6_GLUTH|nr:hypothetical protein NBRC3257_0626 [Gluconobacter thailandicus NBRC 3257]